MKKSVFVLGFLVSTLLSAQPRAEMDTVVTASEDLPVKSEKVAFDTEKLKAQWVKIQLKHESKDLTKSIKLLKELQPIIQKMEKQIRKK